MPGQSPPLIPSHPLHILSNRCSSHTCFPLQVSFQLAIQPGIDRASWNSEGFPGLGCWECRKGNGWDVGMGSEDSYPLLAEMRSALIAGGWGCHWLWVWI